MEEILDEVNEEYANLKNLLRQMLNFTPKNRCDLQKLLELLNLTHDRLSVLDQLQVLKPKPNAEISKSSGKKDDKVLIKKNMK